MASNFMREPPRYDGRKELKQQVREICDYLFTLRETLEYILQHIGPENLSPEVRRRLKDMEEQLQKLTEVAG